MIELGDTLKDYLNAEQAAKLAQHLIAEIMEEHRESLQE